jgi:cytidylate kinase
VRNVAVVSCRAVCISQCDGAGGDEVGRLAATQLGFLYVDDEIVAEAAAKGGISSADVADEERRKSAVSRILEELGRSIAIDSTGLASSSAFREGAAAPEAVRSLITDAIEQVAGRGDAVIASHAGSFALTGRPDVLRVFVTASPATRARRLSETHGMPAADAEKAIKDGDAARRDYLRRFYGVSEELPTHYDLVLNTDVLTIEQAAGLVAEAAGTTA